MLPNLGPGELIIILAIALIVFGPKKLPDIGKGIGSALREFNKARNDFMESINSEMDDDDTRRSRRRSADSEPSDAYSDPYPHSVPAESQPVSPAALAQSADALPYGGDFQPEGDSQPSFRTTHPDPEPRTQSSGAHA